jgi:hypothetical protein
MFSFICRYNLRPRRYAKPYWIQNETRKQYGIERKSFNESFIVQEAEYKQKLKSSGVSEHKLYKRESIGHRFLKPKDKIQFLTDHMKQEKKQPKKTR